MSQFLLVTMAFKWRAFHASEQVSFLLLVCFITICSIGVVGLAPLANRRKAVSNFVGAMGGAAFPFLVTPPFSAQASLTSPRTSAITTVILGSSKDRIGVELTDVTIGTRSFPVVKNVAATGEANANGVLPGMILLGIQGGSSRAVVERIKNGPYPIVLQFYNLAMDNEAVDSSVEQSPEQALVKGVEAGRKESDTGPPVSSKGTGLVVKTITKGNCDARAKRGDTLVVNYEARVASPGGPIFDQGSNARFTMGTKQVVDGVDIGLAGMCQGETRTLDIPSALGFGPKGSVEFDVPGDVRLWWKVELIKLIQKE